MRNRIIALMLLLTFAVASTEGCSSKDGQGNKGNNKIQENGDQKGQSESDGNHQKEQSDSQGKSSEMGRFLESEVSLPDLKEEEQVIKIIRGRENQIEVYTVLKEEHFLYRLNEDKTWESGEADWLNGSGLSGDGVVISDLCLGEDGNYYVAYVEYSETEAISHILKSEDNKTVQEMILPYLTQGRTYDDFTIYPRVQNMAVTENGNLVLWDDGDSLLVFSPEGEKLDQLPTIYSADTGIASFAADRNDVILVSQDRESIIFYNTATKETEKNIPYEAGKDSKAFAVKKDGTVLMGDSKGIHRLAKGGTMWETTVDGALNSMSMPSIHFDELFATDGEEEQYYASYLDSDTGFRLLQYTFDQNVSSVPAQEITVYSLRENKTIRQAISLFQAEHMDIKVNYVAAMGEEGGTVSDYIRALNTELLAGNGADILVLDGLPEASYVEKGVLTDLSELIKPLEESGELLTNISSCYQSDGRIYQMPLRIAIPLVVGKEDGIAAMKDMDSILSYIEKEKEIPFGSPITYQALLQDYLALYAQELYVDGKPDKERLTAFLEKLKKIADNRKAVEYFNDDTDDGEAAHHFIDSGKLFRDRGLAALIKNKYSSGVDQIGNFFNASLSYAISEQADLEVASVNQRFIPKGLVGLNHSGADKETAKEFIRFLFSQEVQDTDVYEGFPVNSNSLDKWAAEERDVSFAMSDEEGNFVEGEWPAEEEREHLRLIIGKLNSPIEIDQTVYGIILEEALPYFTGEMDAGQAASAAYTKLSTYLAE